MKRILIYLCLCVSIAACATSTALPTITPTVIPAQTVAPTAAETLIPSPTVEMTPSPVATPTEDPNTLTYKNADQVEVTIDLSTHEHVNPDGSKEKWVEVPDNFALLKYLADRVVWHTSFDLEERANDVVQGPDGIIELYKKWGLGWPPPRLSRPGVTAFPPGNNNAMILSMVSIDGGSIAGGRDEDGMYVFAYVSSSVDEMWNLLIPSTDTPAFQPYDYIRELASEHNSQ